MLRLLSDPIRLEIRSLYRLAWPVVVSQLAMMMMHVVDTIMVGQLSADALAAVAVANIYVFSLMIVPLGILMGLDPIISQAWGAGNREAAGRAMWRGMFLSALLSIPLSIGWALAGPALALLQQPPHLIPLAEAYVFWLIPSSLAGLAFSALRQSIQAIGITRPIMTVALISNVFNFAADWVLIFGNLGFPALGIDGAAIATSLSRWFMLGLLFAIIHRQGHIRDLRPREPFRLLEWRPLWTIVCIGFPVGMQIGLEVWAFSIAGLAVGQFGGVALAGHQVALQLGALAFMLPFGLSAAASVRVGQAVGRGNFSEMRTAAWVALAAGVGVAGITTIIFTLVPDWLVSTYSNDREVLALAASLLLLAAAFQLFDGLQVVGFGVLRGAGDTRMAMVINFVGYYLVALPIGWTLAFSAGLGPHGVWIGLVAGLIFISGLVLWRMRAYLNRNIRPVTPD